MRVICQCPNCLGDVVGRFQRSCVVCGTDIPVELRMARALELEVCPVELCDWEAPNARERAVAGGGALTVAVEHAIAKRNVDVFDADLFVGVLDGAEQEQPRDMDWEDEKPVVGDRRRRWFRR
jgi:hypothetical protein